MGTKNVVVIGGGIWGLSTAYHLASSRQVGSVLLLERNHELADETTRQAAGQVGQLRGTRLMAEGVGYTLELLSNFQQQTGHDPGFFRSGSLHLALNQQRLAAFVSQMPQAAKLGIDVRLASDRLISQIAPSIDQSQIEGAIYLPNDGYVESVQCAKAFAAAAKDCGAEIRLGTEVTGFEIRDQQLIAVLTNQGEIETSAAVITAGPWTRAVAELAAFSVPIQPIRLQQARTVVDPEMPAEHPVVRIPDRSRYLRPEKGGYLYGFFDPDPLAIQLSSQPAGFRTKNIEPPLELMEEARQRLEDLFPRLADLVIEEYRQGMVTCTPDSQYVVGPVLSVKGIWVGSGCGAMGVAGSAAVGRWLSRWIIEGDPGQDLTALRPDRFGDYGRDSKWITDQARKACANYYSLSKGRTYTNLAEQSDR